MSHLYTVSNPYRNTTESTYGITTYTYDALGRTTQVAEPDGSVVSTSYTGTQTGGAVTTVTDEVGNQRTNQTDGLGRLTYVWEAPNNSNYNYQTVYAYDPLNNLLSVKQTGGSRTRTFTYDSLSRLLCAANPEVQIVTCPTSGTTFPAGAITYTYDLNGNLSSKVEPRPNQTSGTLKETTNYSYDALNRLTQKAYVGLSTSTVKFGYDGGTAPACGQDPPAITSPTNLIGRRSAMCAGKSGSSWSYDSMGRPLLESRINQSPSKQKTLKVSYTYNLDGSLNTLAYPSGDVVTYTVGGAGRVTQVSDANNNYVMNPPCSGCAVVSQAAVPLAIPTIMYWPFGGLFNVYLGASASASGIYREKTYNNRLQPLVDEADDRATGNTFLSRTYNFHWGSGDNGNLVGITDGVNSIGTAVFAYDPLNRISQANSVSTTPPNCWGEVYTIDAWGNLTNRAGVSGMTGCSYEPLNAAPATAQNQLPGVSYDIAGNVLNDGNGNTPTYDAENRVSTDAGVTYYYDADGVRMEKSSGTMYWPGPSGEYLAETDLTGTINEEYIYFNGERIARVDRPSGTVHYYFSDHLHSASVITDASGNVEQQYYYYPYGGLVSSTGSDPNHYKFNGKERDTESGLDYFGARYNSSSLGRFMTPDWAARPTTVPYAVFGDPQSLNLYTYVRNDPVSRGDADGHVVIWWQFPDFNFMNSVSESQGSNSAVNIETAAQAQNQPTSGEGSQANESRREGIADAAVDTKQRADLGQKQYGPNQCSAFVAGCISKAGAKAEFDNSGRPPVAGEWANKKANIPDWRPLGSKEKPAPGDVAGVHILNPHPGATGDSAIVVMRGNSLSAIQAGDHGVEYNSNFIHGYKDVVYWRYTGD